MPQAPLSFLTASLIIAFSDTTLCEKISSLMLSTEALNPYRIAAGPGSWAACLEDHETSDSPSVDDFLFPFDETVLTDASDLGFRAVVGGVETEGEVIDDCSEAAAEEDERGVSIKDSSTSIVLNNITKSKSQFTHIMFMFI